MRLTSKPQKAGDCIFKTDRRSPSRAILLALSLSATAAVLGAARPVLADDDSASSMDSIWVDQSAKGATKKPNSNPPAAGSASASTTPAEGAAPPNLSSAPEGTSVDAAAPMCTVGAFKESALVTGNGWSGLGPFKASADNSEFTDDKQNRIKLELSGDLITHAELTMTNYQPVRDPVISLLNMQMQIDFFLESVGLKPSRIQNVNVQLDRNKDTVLNVSGAEPLNITTGRYALILEKRASTAGGFDYVVAINSMDANKKLIKQPWVSSEPKKEPAAPEMKVSPPLPPAAATTPSVDKSQLKSQFVALINNWQKIKKEAVKTKSTEQLSSVLAGKALARQTDALKYLVTNHRSYDMNPKGAVVDQFTEILPAKKYMVAAQVREAYKLIDDQTGKTLKEVDDVNKVNYTVEKVGSKWVITDSKLLSPNASATPNYASRSTSQNNPH